MVFYHIFARRILKKVFDLKILQLNVCESDKLLYFCIPKKCIKTVKNLIDVRNCRDSRPTV